jgi:hypothetical protein
MNFKYITGREQPYGFDVPSVMGGYSISKMRGINFSSNASLAHLSCFIGRQRISA